MYRLLEEDTYKWVLEIVGRYEPEFRKELEKESILVEETTGSYITTGDDPVYNRTWEEV